MTSETRLEQMALAAPTLAFSWYTRAWADILWASNLRSWDPARVADLLAIFSPRVSVTRSAKMAVHYLHTGTVLRPCIRSVRTALAHYENTGEIRGPKTSAFSRALRGDTSAIVLDVWMARALGVPDAAVSRKRIATEAAERISRVGATIGHPPRDTQSAIWHTTILSHSRNPKPLLLSEHLPLF